MADDWNRSRKGPLNSLHHLCDELGIEDGADPRIFFRRGDRSPRHETERLCGAVHRALSLCPPSMLDGAGVRVGVESVEPTSTPGWLLVVLRADQRLDAATRGR